MGIEFRFIFVKLKGLLSASPEKNTEVLSLIFKLEMAAAKFEWHPAKLLEDNDGLQDFALLVLNQPLKNGAILRRLWKNSSLRVAADGGANRLHQLSSFQGKFSNLQAIIGDLDSLCSSVRDFYS